MSGNIVDATLEAQRRQTQSLIDTGGREIALHRPSALINDGAGGKKRLAGNDVTFVPVTRFFGAISNLGRGASTRPLEWITTSLGERYHAFYVLIGTWDDDIRKDDYFFINDKKYEVVFLHEEVDAYQTKAIVGLVK